MSKVKEMIVEAVLPAIKAVGKVEMKSVLSVVKQHNRTEVYQSTLKGLHANFSLLKDVASKTNTRIDDGIIELILEAVKESAEIEGIAL
jgi:hypothetical protein